MSALSVYLLVYGILALSHICLQMLLAHLEYVRQRRLDLSEEYRPSVTVVVPAYNEDPDLLYECLRSLDRQDYDQFEVIVMDDGSRNREELLPIQEEFTTARFRVLLAPRNMGKRHCQGVVFNEAKGEVIVTVDSDTTLQPDSIGKIVRRLADPRNGAVTGNVKVINQGENFLTRLISYRYWSAFHQERAAQSLFRVLMCASGPFSAYRRSIIDEVKERYVSQRFLGEACTFGDDRHLTNLVLQLGHGVVFDKDAIGHTHVPNTIPKYLRQQVRWNKSFYREILWTARFAHRRHPYLGIDLTLQALLPFMLLSALAAMLYQAIFIDVRYLWVYLGVLLGIGLLRASYGLWRTRSLGFLTFAAYGVMHVFLLIPTRMYSLATMRRSHWGSRSADVPSDQAAGTMVAEPSFGREDLERKLRELRGGDHPEGGGGAVLALDLDGFRDVNLVHGYRAGERFVHEVAQALRHRVGELGTVTRIGGDEFAVLLSDAQRAQTVAGQIQETISSKPFRSKGNEVRLSASIGIAPLQDRGAAGNQPLARAEFAMYRAKEAGRDQVVLLDGEGWDAGTVEEMTWAARIREALDEDAFELEAQPLLHLPSGDIEQWELLIHLRQAGEVIPPSSFLPTAERFGLVEHLDRWVVSRATALLAEHANDGDPVRLEVSLSGRSIANPAFLDALEQRVDPDLVRPWDLILAIREGVVLGDLSAAARFSEGVHSLGCRVALDDFNGDPDSAALDPDGLAPDVVKLSGHMARDLPRPEADRERIRGIAEFARRRGVLTVAQFVADEEALVLLRQYGLDYAQGYYVGEPGPVSEIGVKRLVRLADGVGTLSKTRRARLGESIVLQGRDTQVRVAAVRVIDPGRGARKRVVAVELEMENLGELTYADAPSNCGQLITDRGHRARGAATRALVWGDGSHFKTRVELLPGATERGRLPFLVRRGQHAGLLRFTLDSGFASQVGEWTLE
jgi:hyaluronan synthase